MGRKKILLHLTGAVLLFTLISSTTSCFEDTSDEYTVRIISNTENFSGYIIPDNDAMNLIVGTPLSGSVYLFQVTYNNIETLYINASLDGTDSANITVFIYLNDEKVKEETLAVYSSSSSRTITVSYTDGSSDTSTTEE